MKRNFDIKPEHCAGVFLSSNTEFKICPFCGGELCTIPVNGGATICFNANQNREYNKDDIAYMKSIFFDKNEKPICPSCKSGNVNYYHHEDVWGCEICDTIRLWGLSPLLKLLNINNAEGQLLWNMELRGLTRQEQAKKEAVETNLTTGNTQSAEIPALCDIVKNLNLSVDEAKVAGRVYAKISRKIAHL